jgi:hypothetical protein
MPQKKPSQPNLSTKKGLDVSRLLLAIFLFIKTLFFKALDSLDKFAQGIKRGVKSIVPSIKVSVSKFNKRYATWKKTQWANSIKPSLSKFFKSGYDFCVIVIMYGLMINFMAIVFFQYPFNIKTIIAFGLAVYFIKYEITEMIIKIRGPKIPPIVMP